MEENVIFNADKRMSALRLLKEMLDIPSVNGKDREQNVAAYVAEYLNKKGMEAMVRSIDETHGNLVAILKGKSDDLILFNGHIDTVPYGDMREWDTDPAVCVEKDGKIYGRGTSDMKSGLAAMAFVLGEMAQSGMVPEKTIVLVGTCDEEKGGLGARAFLDESPDLRPELLLIGEPTACRAGVAQKGCIWLELSVSGKTSHGAEPWQGINALEQGVQVLMELREELQKEVHPILGNSTLQITMGNGGIAPNMTPDRAKFLADIRIVPPITENEVLTRLEVIMRRHCQACGSGLTFLPKVVNYRMPVETEENDRWLLTLEGILGEDARRIGINYFTDASVFLTDWPGCPVLLFGPGEPKMCHKPNEYVKIDRYFEAIKVLEKFCGFIAK